MNVDDVDVVKVQFRALIGASQKAESSPALGRWMRDAITRDPAGWLKVELWEEDGEAVVLLAGHVLWRGPLTSLMTPEA
jgi:hypothetical protein